MAEGKTDQIVIEAVLRAIVGSSFVLTLIQPETSDPFGGAGPLGGGWAGVYRWCRQLVSMQYSVAENPSLTGFDLVLLHVDADVAGTSYSDADIDDERIDLPCERPCPPAEDSVNALRQVVPRWLDLPAIAGLPEKWVLCIPSKSTEAWVVAARYGATGDEILEGLECNLTLESWLSHRPKREEKIIKWKDQKCRKVVSAYRAIAATVTNNWGMVSVHCPQAKRFSDDVRMGLEGINT